MSSPDHASGVLTTAAITPIMLDVIARWHRHEAEIDAWETTAAVLPARTPEGWARLVERLQMINTYQWHEEDKSRDHGADDTVLAAVKRSIDASNRRRVQTVDRLDDWLHRYWQAADVLNPAAPLNSETPGSIIDRLTVLALKVHHVTEARDQAAPGSPAAASMQKRLDTLTEQSRDLGVCFDAQLDGIRSGRIGLKLYRQVKVYRRPGTGEIVADLD